MLYSIDTLKYIHDIPHPSFYDSCCAKLNDQEMSAIKDALNSKIDADKVHTSSWMPGSNWNGTPFQPIYDKACGQDLDASARLFGILVWVVFQERPEAWAFGRYEKDYIPIKGMTYFKVQVP